jgi:twitching motility protein PilT
MISIEQSMSALVQSGWVSYEDAVARSLYPNDIQRQPLVRVGAPA